MSIPATQLRPGMIIKHNNDLHSVFSVEHRTPGNLRAFIQAKLRNLRTGAMFEHRFRSPDPIERVNVDEVDMQFLYADGDSYYFMDTSNYEQTHLSKEILGDAVIGPLVEPEYAQVSRWRRAMAQYAVGHQARIDQIQAQVAALPGLRLVGNAYDGIGIPDCIRLGRNAAKEMLAHTKSGIQQVN